MVAKSDLKEKYVETEEMITEEVKSKVEANVSNLNKINFN